MASACNMPGLTSLYSITDHSDDTGGHKNAFYNVLIILLIIITILILEISNLRYVGLLQNVLFNCYVKRTLSALKKWGEELHRKYGGRSKQFIAATVMSYDEIQEVGNTGQFREEFTKIDRKPITPQWQNQATFNARKMAERLVYLKNFAEDETDYTHQQKLHGEMQLLEFEYMDRLISKFNAKNPGREAYFMMYSFYIPCYQTALVNPPSGVGYSCAKELGIYVARKPSKFEDAYVLYDEVFPSTIKSEAIDNMQNIQLYNSADSESQNACNMPLIIAIISKMLF